MSTAKGAACGGLSRVLLATARFERSKRAAVKDLGVFWCFGGAALKKQRSVLRTLDGSNVAKPPWLPTSISFRGSPRGAGEFTTPAQRCSKLRETIQAGVRTSSVRIFL